MNRDPLNGRMVYSDTTDKGDVVTYMNTVLEEWGPPCEWCHNWDDDVKECSKKHRPRKYPMALGKWESWTLRKLCLDHEGVSCEEAGATSDEPMNTIIGGVYGGTNTSIVGNMEF